MLTRLWQSSNPSIAQALERGAFVFIHQATGEAMPLVCGMALDPDTQRPFLSLQALPRNCPLEIQSQFFTRAFQLAVALEIPDVRMVIRDAEEITRLAQAGVRADPYRSEMVLSPGPAPQAQDQPMRNVYPPQPVPPPVLPPSAPVQSAPKTDDFAAFQAWKESQRQAQQVNGPDPVARGQIRGRRIDVVQDEPLTGGAQ